MTLNTAPLDVWFRFEDEDDEEPELEANTFETEFGFTVEWCHTAVGQLSTLDFNTYEEATEWLESRGFIDYTA